jgi:isocitrate dehydrogenase kinase/phosphatase
MSAVAAHDTVSAKDCAETVAEHFRAYNDEFGRITRRAALNFLAEDWQSSQHDAVARIELYEQRVTRCVAAVADELQSRRTEVALWGDIKRAYEMLVARRPDSDFYRTFFNSVSRELFGTVGVNPEVEFGAASVGRASGAVPLRVYRVGGSLPLAVREILADLPFGAAIADQDAAVHRISAEIGRYFEAGRQSGAPESIELIEPVFYRGMHAFAVDRLIGDSAITPLVVAFTNSTRGVQVDAVMLSRADVGSLFGYARSYFHVDLPVVSAAITLLRSFMPRKPIDELYTVLGRAKQGKTERFFALQRHLNTSIDSFVHAPGERGLVMIVFTLPSHDLVFKVIRDQFGAPKTCSRADVIERYQCVFRHDRAGRLVDATGISAAASAPEPLHAGAGGGVAARCGSDRRRGSDRRAMLRRAASAAAQSLSARSRAGGRRGQHHRLWQCAARSGGEQCLSRRSVAQEFRRDQPPARDLLRL